MLDKNIDIISKNLKPYLNLTHNELFTIFVNDKLKSALIRYNIYLDNIEDYLLRKNANMVFKRITNIQRDNDIKELEKAVDKEGDRTND